MNTEPTWQPIETAPDMLAMWLAHPYYSHGLKGVDQCPLCLELAAVQRNEHRDTQS